MIIKVSNLTYDYPKVRAIKNLSLSIEEGSITALVGHNGAGKTTLLKCLAGLEKPFSGDIVATQVKTEGTFEAGNPAVLFNSPLQQRIGFQIGPYDVSGDGQRFLLNASLSGTSNRKLIIVLNMSEQI